MRRGLAWAAGGRTGASASLALPIDLVGLTGPHRDDAALLPQERFNLSARAGDSLACFRVDGCPNHGCVPQFELAVLDRTLERPIALLIDSAQGKFESGE